jgi:hypothetical protein
VPYVTAGRFPPDVIGCDTDPPSRLCSTPESVARRPRCRWHLARCSPGLPNLKPHTRCSILTRWTGQLASAAANRSWRWSCGQPKLSRRCPPCREAGTSLPRPSAHRGGLTCAAALCDIVRLSRPPTRLQPRCWLAAASALRALLRPHNVWASRPYDPTSCVVSTPIAPPRRKRPVSSVMRAHPAETGCPLIRGDARRRLLATLTSRCGPASLQSGDGASVHSGSPPRMLTPL